MKILFLNLGVFCWFRLDLWRWENSKHFFLQDEYLYIVLIILMIQVTTDHSFSIIKIKNFVVITSLSSKIWKIKRNLYQLNTNLCLKKIWVLKYILTFKTAIKIVDNLDFLNFTSCDTMIFNQFLLNYFFTTFFTFLPCYIRFFYYEGVKKWIGLPPLKQKIRRYRHNCYSLTNIILEIYRKPTFACISSACMCIPSIWITIAAIFLVNCQIYFVELLENIQRYSYG